MHPPLDTGIPNDIQNACKAEVHVLRPDEDVWQLYTGKYYSEHYTTGLILAYVQLAKDLHTNSIFNVRVVIHEVVKGSRRTAILVDTHDKNREMRMPTRFVEELPMTASQSDMQPKQVG